MVIEATGKPEPRSSQTARPELGRASPLQHTDKWLEYFDENMPVENQKSSKIRGDIA